MRPVAISALLLLALAGLAVVPTASAAPPSSPCNGTVAGSQTVGPVTVFYSPPCYDVYVRAMSCPLGNGEWTDLKVKDIGVHVYTCAEDLAAASMAPPCTCPPPPRCNPITTVGPVAEVVSVTLTSDCRVIVSILPRLVACTDPLDGAKATTVGKVTLVVPCGDIDQCEIECYPTSASSATLPVPPICGPTAMCTEPECPWPMGGEVHQEVTAPVVGPIRVDNDDCGPQDLCSGPLRCTNPLDRSSAVLIPPVCIEREVEQGAVHAGYSTCYDEFVEVVACSGGGAQGVHYYNDLGPAYVRVDYCLPHTPPPMAAASSGPCGATNPQQRCPAPVPLCSGVKDPVEGSAADVDVSSSCQILVTVDVIDCLWGQTWTYQTVGPVTLRYTTCSDPTETAAAAPPCVCPPPQPLCYDVNRAIAWNDYYQIDDSCNVTVNLPAYCGLQGTEDHQQRVGKLTVNYQTCQQPPVE